MDYSKCLKVVSMERVSLTGIMDSFLDRGRIMVKEFKVFHISESNGIASLRRQLHIQFSASGRNKRIRYWCS